MTRVRKILGGITLVVLATILYLGLWPNNVRSNGGIHFTKTPQGRRLVIFPPNEVEWLKDGPGLHFGDYGSIFSKTEFAASPNGADGCTFEVWLAPAVTEDYDTTTLAFSTKENPLQFRLRQLEDSLSVSHDTLDEKHHIHTDKIWVDHVFHERQQLLITLASGSNGTTVYLNGKLRAHHPGFKLKATDFTGTFVFGNSPQGHETWGGDLRGMAVYPFEMSVDQAQQNYGIWKSGGKFPPKAVASAGALYYFAEGTGSVTRSAVAGAPDLYIPESYQSLRPILLKPFWREYDGTWGTWIDAFLNVMAFVPFGFFLCAYLKNRGSEQGAVWRAVIAGFMLSLTIEVGQYFLPMRNSGTTDLITNTTGTWLGALLVGTKMVGRTGQLVVKKWQLIEENPKKVVQAGPSGEMG